MGENGYENVLPGIKIATSRQESSDLDNEFSDRESEVSLFEPEEPDQEDHEDQLEQEKLKDRTTREKFQSELSSKFARILLLNNDQHQSQKLCDEFTNGVTDAAKKVLGKRRKKKRPWISEEVFDSCDQRRELKSKRSAGGKHLDE
eukprot:gene19773-21708_t